MAYLGPKTAEVFDIARKCSYNGTPMSNETITDRGRASRAAVAVVVVPGLVLGLLLALLIL